MLDLLSELAGYAVAMTIVTLWCVSLLLAGAMNDAIVHVASEAPLEITLHFQYGGESYQRSFAVLAHLVSRGHFGTVWRLKPSEISVGLHDSSALIIPAYVFEPWEYDYRHRPHFPANPGDTLQTEVTTWIWVDKEIRPSRAFRAHFSPENLPPTGNFTLIEPGNTIVARITRLGGYSLDRARQTSRELEEKKMLGASGIGYINYAGRGDLFGGITSQELSTAQSAILKRTPGWVETDGGCKALFDTQDNRDAFRQALRDGGDKRDLIYDGTGGWERAGSFFPLNPMFRLGPIDASSENFVSGFHARSFVKLIRYAGHQCQVPPWSTDSTLVAVWLPGRPTTLVLNASLARFILIGGRT